MKNKKTSIKSALLKLFNEGKSEAEALEEVSKTHSSRNVSDKTVNKWYEKFRSENQNLENGKVTGTRKKFSDEFLIDIVNNNPGFNMNELAKLAGVSPTTISNRIKGLNGDERLNYKTKGSFKFTDEFLIDLVNKNPDLTTTDLAKLAGVSATTISSRIKGLNGDERLSYKTKGSFKFTDEFLIDLVNKNPDLTTADLAKLAGVSPKTISNRIKGLNGDERLNYKTKGGFKFTDEFLIDLVNKNPDLTTADLAKLAGVSATTISSRIKGLNGDERLNYKIKDNSKFTDEFLIDLVNKNPELSMEKLANIAGVSRGTIFSRIKQLKSGNKKVNYCDKDNYKFTDEFLIDLINKNPTLNMNELAKLADTLPSNISIRIKQINSNGIRVNYVKKKYIPDGYNTSNTKLTYGFLDDLINSSPDLTMHELAELAGVSASTISRKIKQFNKAGKKKFTDEFLIDLVNKNPELSMEELAKFTCASHHAIFKRIKNLNDDERLNYSYKDTKLTVEFFIDLINKNPDLNIHELAKLADVSPSVISNRIKQINNNEEKVKYCKKSRSKLTDEYITDLVNENPELNLKELAELAGVSTTTISRRIKQINSNGVVANYTNKNK